MRVLHASQATQFGLLRYLSDLVHDQARRGWDVTLATPPDDELIAACRDAGVTHRPWEAVRAPGPSTWGETRRLGAIVRDIDPDVVQLHSSKAGLAGRLAIRGRRPTVFTPHAWSFFHGGRVTRALAHRWEQVGARWATLILCVSERERELGAQAGVHGRWAVVPNGVDLARFAPLDPTARADARRRLGIGTDTRAVVCIGRLAPQKGQDLLVQAWTEVHERHPAAELYLVGDGPDRAQLEASAAALAPTSVHFVGTTADTASWLACSDLVVQPSRWEGFSIAVLEAIASGCSVVATDVAGMREAIGEGADAAGAIVPVEDVSALGQAVDARLRDDALVQREREHARARAANHSIDIWGDRVAAVLEQAVAEHGR